MKLWFLPLVAISVAAAQDRPPTLSITKAELPNGLKLVMHEDHSRPVINLQVWYHVGSKDEREGRTGFAHLFEHLMFRGSKNVGPEEHMKYVREAGGQVNAYTSFDQTVYWETFPSNYLERMLWLEADRMSSLNISEENFTKEREVVKEERRLRYENPPYGMISADLWAMEYQQYPYKHPPIGSMEDLNKATVADVQQFFDTFYVPNNATVVSRRLRYEGRDGLGQEMVRRHSAQQESRTARSRRGAAADGNARVHETVREHSATRRPQSIPPAASRAPRQLRSRYRIGHPFAWPKLPPL
jgi:hypothetical protein